MTAAAPEHYPSPFATGFACRCPRCGQGRLFTGYLQLNPRCAVCDLDLSFAQGTEGPAVFIILIVGTIILVAAGVVEGLFHPPPFVHLLLWLPSTVVVAMLLLRPFKATMIALAFVNRVEEGHPDG